MKFANLDGRATLIDSTGAIDVAELSGGRLGPDPMSVLARWGDLTALVGTTDLASVAQPYPHDALRNPVPEPRQVFAIGLNYRGHAAETGMPVPDVPITFTKFPASLAGPGDEITLGGSTDDWEAELVVVIGRRADRVSADDAWSYVAGLAMGQDISDRTLQSAAGNQFSLGKSRRGYGPIGPWLVTPDEFDDPTDIEIGCRVNGEVMQRARTSDLVFSVADLIAELSAILPLLAGDVIFTGTPAGVGVARKPPRFLQPGDVIETWGDGIGEMTNRCV